MKTNITFFFFVFGIITSFAQIPPSEIHGGEFIFNTQNAECITQTQRHEIFSNLNESINQLKNTNQLAFSHANRSNHPLFVWPVQKSGNSTFNDVWGVSNYVDHNQNTPNQLTDFNCGVRTYDTTSGYNHQGLDVFSWPFGWYLMDNDEVEIIAAAPGQIIAKNDGNFDRSCDFSTTTPWNAVYVQHSDGSIAWYGHLKNNSLTTKNIGDMVSEGEFLGVMGSSGISTGPHLHFEVYTDATYTQLVDPYAGTCNTMNTETWWQSQKPYNSPGINAALTHTSNPIFPNCPTTETINEKNQFDLNETVTHYIYLRDQVAGTMVNLRIIRPDNTDLFNWNFNLTDNYVASYWGGWTSIPNIAGEWKWEATYNGETVTHSYNVGVLNIDEKDFNLTSIYPNPFDDIVNISSSTKINKASVFDLVGKTALVVNESSADGLKQLNLSKLSKGVYFVTLEGEKQQRKTIRLIKK